MSLKHALLGFLNYGPMTGYELKKFFDNSVAHFWNAELSQIYPSLKLLESEGLVEMKVDVQNDRPNRKVYTITHDGREELIDWLGRPAGADQLREPLLIKVFFGAAGGKDEIIRVLRHRIDELTRANEYYEKSHYAIKAFARTTGMEKDALFWDLTTECGLRHNRASIEWAQEVIRRVEQMDGDVFQQPTHGVMNARSAVEMLERMKNITPVETAAT